MWKKTIVVVSIIMAGIIGIKIICDNLRFERHACIVAIDEETGKTIPSRITLPTNAISMGSYYDDDNVLHAKWSGSYSSFFTPQGNCFKIMCDGYSPVELLVYDMAKDDELRRIHMKRLVTAERPDTSHIETPDWFDYHIASSPLYGDVMYSLQCIHDCLRRNDVIYYYDINSIPLEIQVVN